jgi:hypothetical protein
MLTTLSNLKAHLGLTGTSDKDTLLTKIIAGASAFIESATRRKFGIQSYVETLDGQDDCYIRVNQTPILEVTKITIDGTEVSLATEVTNRTIKYNLKTGHIYRAYGWGSDFQNVVIEYQAGYILPDDEEESGEIPEGAENLPEDLEMACIRLCARVFERRTSEGISTSKPAMASYTFQQDIDPDIKATLDYYRRILA